MNITGFTHLTYEDLCRTSNLFKPPAPSTKLAAGLQKPGQDIWDWLCVQKPKK